ncbi:MAG: hypothetical protein HQ567_18775 [Candidatus Nealsonbacteria bacterium]|nr:hypothetical protein [Candidatus Nealsonbacteria bacterium]
MAQSENERKSPSAGVSDDSERSGKTSAASDVLDWDACLDDPPSRPSGTIKVHLRPCGRDKPIPVDTPVEEQPEGTV